jgi:hypothetical protein
LPPTCAASARRGELNISIDSVEALARALGVEAADLMKPATRK